jgi:alkyldihydroxyacetonephosphate synthase
MISRPDPSSLGDELRALLPHDRVVDDPTERALRAADFWPRLVMARRRGEPAAGPAVVVSPESREEVAAVLRWCTEHGVPVVPYGAGTGVCGGASADARGVTLDMRRMSRVVTLDEISGTVTVEPGIFAQTLEDHLRHRGWTLGHYPSSMHCSTIGGFLAIRSAGQASTSYGKLEEMVIGLEAVLADGTVFTAKPVPSSAAGPDLKRLFIGGEGTTGVITQATLRIRPAPAVALDRAVLFPDMETALAGIRRIMRTGLRPTVYRLYDETDTAVVFGAQGRDVPDGCLVIIAAEGEEEIARFSMDLFIRLLVEGGGDDLGPELGEHWRAHRHDVSYRFAEYMKPDGAFGDAVMLDTMEIASVWSRLEESYSAVREALAQHADLVLAHVSHVYAEGASIYFTFGAAPQTHGEQEALERYDAAWDAGQRAALAVGATISHHHGVGLARVPWLADELGPGGLDVLRRVKAALDPGGILSPGTLGLGERG